MLVTRNTKLIYINSRGRQIKLSPFSLYFLQKCEEKLENEITAEKQLGNGEIYVGSSLSSRRLELDGFVDSKINIEEIRRKIIGVFNPTLNGKLIYSNQNMGKDKVIEVKVESVPSVVWEKKLMRFSIDLVAHNPFWKECQQSKLQIALWKGDFHFPLVIPVNKGIIMGHREPSLIVNVNNKGQTATGMIIEFLAKGTLTNPSLFNINTREFIKVNKKMVAGEKIIINTNFGKKKVLQKLNGVTTDILNYLDIIGGGDTFLQLDVGDNLFRYNADSNINNLEVSICFSPQYLGV